MVLMALFTTFITTPIVRAVYKPARKKELDDYKYRTIERKNPDSQLRILACFYSTRGIASLINLLEASRGTEKSEALSVFALHLMELSERSSAIRMVHKARKNGLPFWNKRRQSSNSDNVIVAFEAFQQLSKVKIRPMTSISSFTDMHEDICITAERKRAAIIILPFHKHQRVDGSMETTRTDFRWVNQKVLEHSPCSVGIFVDRGLGGNAHVSASNVAYFVTVLFFGGPDDREALSYGTRMAEHPGIKLIIVRFLTKPEMLGDITSVDMGEASGNATTVSLDEECLSDFKTPKNPSVEYKERFVGIAADAIAAIREESRCSLFVVGRRPEGGLALAMQRRGECPELGPVGGLLAASDFNITASVLVVQQYDCGGNLKLSLETEEESPPGKDSE